MADLGVNVLGDLGVSVCCPVHDALLIEAPADNIEDAAKATPAVMQRASEIVLDGFPLRTKGKVVRHMERYSDKRGKAMWKIISGLCGRAP